MAHYTRNRIRAPKSQRHGGTLHALGFGCWGHFALYNDCARSGAESGKVIWEMSGEEILP